MRRYKFILDPPAGSDDEPRSFETPPLEPIEFRSLLMVAGRLLAEDWSVTVRCLPEGEP